MVDEFDYWRLKYTQAKTDVDAARANLFKSIGGTLEQEGSLWLANVNGKTMGFGKTPNDALVQFENIFYREK